MSKRAATTNGKQETRKTEATKTETTIAMTVATQRVQIALYGLQIQDAAVARATQRLDDARNRRLGAEAGRDHTASQIQLMEGKLAAGTLQESDAKDVQAQLPQIKSELEAQTSEVQNRQAAEAEASSEFRREKAKLVELQDRIERLDKALEKLGASAHPRE